MLGIMNTLVGVSQEAVGGEAGGRQGDEATVLRLGGCAQDWKSVKHNRNVSIYVEVLLCVCGNPCFAFGGFDLQAAVGQGGDPERPNVVEEGRVTRDDDIVDICKDGDEFAWWLSEVGGKG